MSVAVKARNMSDPAPSKRWKVEQVNNELWEILLNDEVIFKVRARSTRERIRLDDLMELLKDTNWKPST